MGVSWAKIVAGSQATSVGVNTPLSQLAAAIDSVDAKTGAGILHGTSGIFTGTAISDGLYELKSSITALSSAGTITGISGKTFTIYQGFAGTPVDNLSLYFERGTSANAEIRWDETADAFKATVAGQLATLASRYHEGVIDAGLFSPCKITGSTTTNITWAPTSDATYFFGKTRLTTDQAAIQYYAFDYLVQLPWDFGSWGSSTGLVINIRTHSTAPAVNDVDILIRHKASLWAAGTALFTAFTGKASTVADTWRKLAIGGASLTAAATWAAHQYLHIKLKCSTTSAGWVEFGPVRRKWSIW